MLLSSVRLEQPAHNQLAAGSNSAGATNSFGQATLPTKGPTDAMGNMVSSSGCRFLYPHANSAPLKVLGGLGTGELNPVSGCGSPSLTFARSMQATQLSSDRLVIRSQPVPKLAPGRRTYQFSLGPVYR